MTNWMTAAGIALIAGGLATLICFRAVLFRTGRRRAGRSERAAQVDRARARQERPGRPERAGRPGRAERVGRAERTSVVRRGSRRRSAAPDEAAAGGFEAPAGGAGVDLDELSEADHEDERHGGLASLGLADEDDYAEEIGEPAFADAAFAEATFAEERADAVFVEERAEPAFAEETEASPEVEDFGRVEVVEGLDEIDLIEELEPAVEDSLEDSAPASSDRYGHRVNGWVRPEYRDFPDHPPTGEYWTPIPVDLVRDPEPSAKGYGWPMAVERLPAVPAYEPATGFDLEPVRSEPTEAMPAWPRRPGDERPGRIRLPSSWSARNETQSFRTVREETDRPVRERRRPRPRPRAEPPADRNTTVYVSRHAAEPPG